MSFSLASFALIIFSSLSIWFFIAIFDISSTKRVTHEVLLTFLRYDRKNMIVNKEMSTSFLLAGWVRKIVFKSKFQYRDVMDRVDHNFASFFRLLDNFSFLPLQLLFHFRLHQLLFGSYDEYIESSDACNIFLQGGKNHFPPANTTSNFQEIILFTSNRAYTSSKVL